MSFRTRILAAALLVVLLLGAGACGGDDEGGSGERPDASALAIKFRNEIGMTPAQAACTAEVLLGSDMSDATLAGVYDADLDANDPDLFRGVDLSTEDREALGVVAQDLTACVGIAPQTSAPPTAPPTSTSTAPETSAPDGSSTTAPAG